jgi:hypothetical protein
MPDTELFAAAERGELMTRAGVEKQVRRMLSDPRNPRDAGGQFRRSRPRPPPRPPDVRDGRPFPGRSRILRNQAVAPGLALIVTSQGFLNINHACELRLRYTDLTITDTVCGIDVLLANGTSHYITDDNPGFTQLVDLIAEQGYTISTRHDR